MVKCPESNFHSLNKIEHIKPLKANFYECTCGCIFKWETPYKWQILWGICDQNLDRFSGVNKEEILRKVRNGEKVDVRDFAKRKIQ